MRLKVSNVCQLLDKSKYSATQTVNGITWTNNGDGTITANGTTTDRSVLMMEVGFWITAGKYCILGKVGAVAIGIDIYADGKYVSTSFADSIFTIDKESVVNVYPVIENGSANSITIKPQLFDLTEMYGAGNEPTTVAQFRQDFPNEMYEYSPVCWKKFRRLKYVAETKNLLSDISVQDPVGVSYDKQSGIFTINSNDKTSVGYANSVMDFITPIPVGTVITVSIYCISGRYRATQGDNTGIGGYHKYVSSTDLNTWQGPVFLPSGTDLSGKTFTTTWTVTKPLDGFWIYVPRQTDIIEEDIRFRAQLELGSTSSPYQPYGYLPLNRGKYIANKEPVQLLDKSKYPATQTINGVTFTNNGDGIITVDGTATTDIYYDLTDYFSINMNHKYIILESNSGTGNRQAFISSLLDDNRSRYGGYYPSNGIFKFASYNGMNPIKAIGTFYAVSGETFTNRTISNFMLFDLTEMYGAGNEPTTVEQFRADYPNELYDYNPYNAIAFR